MSKYTKYLRGRFDRLFYRDTTHLQRFGTLNQWVVMPSLIPKFGVVISGGVGHNIEFEKELAARYGCTIHLFDPTPTGKKTMSLQENVVPGISYYEVGLAGHPGVFEFSYPRDAEEGSFSIAGTDSRRKINLKCDSVVNFMRARGIRHCDLLKLDIEGFEYAVIDDLLAANVVIAQICVEYHHFLPGIPLRRSLMQMWRLRCANYRIAYKTMCEYLYVHRSFWPAF